MTIKEVLQIVVDNDYLPIVDSEPAEEVQINGDWLFAWQKGGIGASYPLHTILFDNLFWEALGRGMGWEHHNCCFTCGADGSWNSIGSCDNCGSTYRFCSKWIYMLHRFIDDVVVDSKTITSFFETLIPPTEPKE
jgi:hypothetical protein